MRKINKIMGLFVVSASLLAVGGCCCGEVGDGFSEGFKKGWDSGRDNIYVEMEGRLARCEDGEDKDKVAKLLNKLQRPEVDKNISLLELSTFKAIFDQAAADEVISVLERKELEKEFAGMKGP